MTWIDLGDPAPRAQPVLYTPKFWAAGERISLPAVALPRPLDLGDVLEQRRTRRDFGAPSIEALSNLLWFSLRTQRTEGSMLGFPLQFRPLPSAGAIHPIHLVVQLVTGSPWRRYDPIQHELATIPCSEHLAEAARNAACQLVAGSGACLLGLVAEHGMTAAKYEAYCSLVWRDTGVILGYLSILAEALNLNFCPLGITGDQSLRPLDEEGRLHGVGLALLGAR